MSFGDILGHIASGFAFGMLTGGGYYGYYGYPMFGMSIYSGGYYGDMDFSPDTSYKYNPYALNNIQYGGFNSIYSEINNPSSNFNVNFWQPFQSTMDDYYAKLREGNSAGYNFNFNFKPFTFSSQYTAPAVTTNTETAKPAEEPKETDSAKKKTYNTSNQTREFTDIYSSLGITDQRFIKIFEESILKSEGRSYIFDVHAMAKNGVQQGTYDTYRKNNGLKKQDVKYMTMKEMCDIYYGIYKDCGADKIKNDRMALYVFDLGVNSGSKRAKEFYAKSGDNPEKFMEMRKNFYMNLIKKDPKKYGENKDGWMNRLNNVKKYADNNFSTIA